MITLNVIENNPLTPKFYNYIISNLQFHRLTCSCNHSACLSVHGYYHRFIKTPTGKLKFRICRVKCSLCGKTHAILLSSFVPYSQISLSEQVAIISSFESDSSFESVMVNNPSIDESNCRYVLKQFFSHWKERLLAYGISFRFSDLLHCFSFYKRQFMQIKSTPNILFLNTT